MTVDDTPTLASGTRDMIETVLTGAFWIPAQLTGLPQWNLNETEAKYLTDNVQTVIKSMGTKRSKRVLALIDKYAPGASLAVAALVITVPRVKMTRAHYATAHAKSVRSGGPESGNVGGDAGQPASAGAPSAGGDGGAWGNLTGNVRPLTVADLEGAG